MVLKDPSVVLKDPSVVLKDPALTLEDPSLALEDPSLALEDPSLALKDPSLALKDPSLALGEPILAFEEPTPALKEPMLDFGSVKRRNYLGEGLLATARDGDFGAVLGLGASKPTTATGSPPRRCSRNTRRRVCRFMEVPRCRKFLDIGIPRCRNMLLDL